MADSSRPELTRIRDSCSNSWTPRKLWLLDLDSGLISSKPFTSTRSNTGTNIVGGGEVGEKLNLASRSIYSYIRIARKFFLLSQFLVTSKILTVSFLTIAEMMVRISVLRYKCLRVMSHNIILLEVAVIWRYSQYNLSAARSLSSFRHWLRRGRVIVF